MYPLPKLKTMVAAVLLANTSLPLIAFSEENSLELDKISVTGILPDRLESVPGSFNVVDEEALVERRPFTVREALNNVPGINIVGEDAFVLAPILAFVVWTHAALLAHCYWKMACHYFWPPTAIHPRITPHRYSVSIVLRW